MKKRLLVTSLMLMSLVACSDDSKTGNPEIEVPPTDSNVMVNELMTSVDTADNSIYTDGQGDFSDWVELINTGETDFDLAGYYFSDRGHTATDDDKYLVPATDATATTVPAEGKLMVIFGAADAANDDIEGIVDGKLFIPTGLSTSKDKAVAIFDSAGELLTMSADFTSAGPEGELTDDNSLGRVTDGAEEWQIFATPTPDAVNSGDAPVDDSGDDSGSAELPSGIENILVNEVMVKVGDMAYSVYTNYDNQGVEDGYADWVELYNDGDEAVDLAGCYITDKGVNASLGDMYLIPTTNATATTVPVNGKLMVIFGGTTDLGVDVGSGNDGGFHNDFLVIPTGLSSKSATSGKEVDTAVAIFDSSRAILVTKSADFSQDGLLAPAGLGEDESLGRVTDGAEEWQIFATPTPDAPNNI